MFGGVGAPPEGKEEVGCCSQMATFTYKDGREQEKTGGIDTPYSVVSVCMRLVLISGN